MEFKLFRVVSKSLLLLLLLTVTVQSSTQPNIIFILADDLGWNDVSFRETADLFTPNIDALAYSGVILNRHYASPVCTPSRASLMTGKYTTHTGTQHRVIFGPEPRGLGLEHKLLPQYLKEIGYSTHMVGKWHLGSYKKVYTPTFRGFDSFLGFWNAAQDQTTQKSREFNQLGFDFRRNMEIANDIRGQYTTNIVTDESVRIIESHTNRTDPLFLYVSQAAVHNGDGRSPLAVPPEILADFAHIEDANLRNFTAMAYLLDESVGTIIEALSKSKLLQNSIIIFTTDNGAPERGFNSGYPLRGAKNSLFEGGTRGTGFIWSPLLEKRERVSNDLIGLVDWLPTLVSAGGGNVDSEGLDGMNHWKELISGSPLKRTELLHNINVVSGSSSITVGNFKVMRTRNDEGESDHISNRWYGQDIKPKMYDIDKLFASKSAKALQELAMMPTADKIAKIRESATLTCGNVTPQRCSPSTRFCMFNTVDDPCEIQHVNNSTLINQLIARIQFYNQTAVPPANQPLDPRGYPSNWDYIWTNFGDYLDLD